QSFDTGIPDVCDGALPRLPDPAPGAPARSAATGPRAHSVGPFAGLPTKPPAPASAGGNPSPETAPSFSGRGHLPRTASHPPASPAPGARGSAAAPPVQTIPSRSPRRPAPGF